MIQVIGGRWKRLRLTLPDPSQTRPTSARTKEGIFNVLAHRLCWQDYKVLDLYAGSGALGIEALSLGVPEALFVEHSQSAYKCLQSNLQKIQCDEVAVKCVKGRALKVLQRHRQVQPFKALIFIDPPYASLEYETILEEIETNPCLTEQTWVIVEMTKTTNLPQTKLSQKLMKIYGDTKVFFLEKL